MSCLPGKEFYYDPPARVPHLRPRRPPPSLSPVTVADDTPCRLSLRKYRSTVSASKVEGLPVGSLTPRLEDVVLFRLVIVIVTLYKVYETDIIDQIRNDGILSPMTLLIVFSTCVWTDVSGTRVDGTTFEIFTRFSESGFGGPHHPCHRLHRTYLLRSRSGTPSHTLTSECHRSTRLKDFIRSDNTLERTKILQLR